MIKSISNGYDIIYKNNKWIYEVDGTEVLPDSDETRTEKLICNTCGKQSVKMLLPVHPSLSHSGKEYLRYWVVDGCISEIIIILMKNGIKIKQSCCGHKKDKGNIVLWDNTIITIEEAKKMIAVNGWDQ